MEKFTEIFNNIITKQNIYCLLINLNVTRKQYGHPSEMADIPTWRTFQNDFNKETNMAGIAIWQQFQSEERYINMAVWIATLL